jgi:hypothetical protein
LERLLAEFANSCRMFLPPLSCPLICGVRNVGAILSGTFWSGTCESTPAWLATTLERLRAEFANSPRMFLPPFSINLRSPQRAVWLRWGCRAKPLRTPQRFIILIVSSSVLNSIFLTPIFLTQSACWGRLCQEHVGQEHANRRRHSWIFLTHIFLTKPACWGRLCQEHFGQEHANRLRHEWRQLWVRV